jgi:hypothetical protein
MSLIFKKSWVRQCVFVPDTNTRGKAARVSVPSINRKDSSIDKNTVTRFQETNSEEGVMKPLSGESQNWQLCRKIIAWLGQQGFCTWRRMALVNEQFASKT